MRLVDRRRLALALSLLAFAVAVDHIIRSTPGIGIVLAAVAGAGLLVGFARPGRWGLALLAAALVVTAFAAVRAAPALVALDLLVAASLTVLAASFAQAGDPLTTPMRAWLGRGVRVLGSIAPGSRSVMPPVALPDRAHAGVAVRTASIVVVVLVVFGAILASADAVFAQMVTRPFERLPDVSMILDHGLGIALIAAASGTLVAYARRPVLALPSGEVQAGFSLGGGEWTVIVASVAALFTAFVLVQVPTLFGGHQRVLDEIGLTYADYARSGFAQMVLAAMLTLALIGVAWVAGAAASVPFRIAAVTLIVLDLIVLVSAFRRLALYEEAYGWTSLRLAGHVFIVWLAILLVIVAVAIVFGGVRWFAFAGIAAALVALLAVNLLNPDAFIAERNLARAGSAEIDAGYLARLSDDAVPTLVAALPDLPADARAHLTAELAQRAICTQPEEPWWSLNLSREGARSAVASYC